MHKLVIKSRFRFFSILGKKLNFQFRLRESFITTNMFGEPSRAMRSVRQQKQTKVEDKIF